MNPAKLLFQSRKFWLMILDLVVSFTTYFVTKYVAPEMSKDILFVIGGLQPVVVVVIAAIAYEDGQSKRTGQFPASHTE